MPLGLQQLECRRLLPLQVVPLSISLCKYTCARHIHSTKAQPRHVQHSAPADRQLQHQMVVSCVCCAKTAACRDAQLLAMVDCSFLHEQMVAEIPKTKACRAQYGANAVLLGTSWCGKPLPNTSGAAPGWKLKPCTTCAAAAAAAASGATPLDIRDIMTCCSCCCCC